MEQEYLEMREVAWTCRLLRKVFLPAVKVGKEVHHHMVLLLDRAFIICAYCGEKCCTEDPAATAEGLFAQFPAHMAQCRYWIEVNCLILHPSALQLVLD